MNNLHIILAAVALVSIYWAIELLIHKRMNASLVKVNSREFSYYVKDLPNKHEAAELLASTQQKMFAVVDRLRTTQDEKIPAHLLAGVRRIVQKHCNRININELDATRHKAVAMNRKKGQEIHVCLRECPDCADLTSGDRLLIVALHELAHSATTHYDPSEDGITQHGDEFKRYEHYIIQVAQDMNLLNPVSVIGRNFCGVRIPIITNPNPNPTP